MLFDVAVLEGELVAVVAASVVSIEVDSLIRVNGVSESISSTISVCPEVLALPIETLIADVNILLPCYNKKNIIQIL